MDHTPNRGKYFQNLITDSPNVKTHRPCSDNIYARENQEWELGTSCVLHPESQQDSGDDGWEG